MLPFCTPVDVTMLNAGMPPGQTVLKVEGTATVRGLSPGAASPVATALASLLAD